MSDKERPKNSAEHGAPVALLIEAGVAEVKRFLSREGLTAWQCAEIDRRVAGSYGSWENLLLLFFSYYSPEYVFGRLVEELPASEDTAEYYQAQLAVGQGLFSDQEWKELYADIATDSLKVIFRFESCPKLKAFCEQLIAVAEVYSNDGVFSVDPAVVLADKHYLAQTLLNFPETKRLSITNKIPLTEKKSVTRWCFVLKAKSPYRPVTKIKRAFQQELVVSDQDVCSRLSTLILLEKELLRVFMMRNLLDSIRHDFKDLRKFLGDLVSKQKVLTEKEIAKACVPLWRIFLHDLETHKNLTITKVDHQSETYQVFDAQWKGGEPLFSLNSPTTSTAFKPLIKEELFRFMGFFDFGQLRMSNSPWPLDLREVFGRVNSIKSLQEIFTYLSELKILNSEYHVNYGFPQEEPVDSKLISPSIVGQN